ncbi:ribosome biogenesis GTP-binding protein YsxC [bacterium]|nr:ribosome biogenesis GTP-binding protein YsxC [bacterium]
MNYTPVSDEFVHQLMLRKFPLRMEFVTSASKIEELPADDVPELAIVGRSNVGKSSLLNFLAGQKQLARVSSTPGRTQLMNVFSAERGVFRLVDLPGYGFAFSPRETQAHWADAMRVFFERRKSLLGILFLMDVRREVNEEDTNLVQWFLQRELGVLLVLTKCDKFTKAQLGLVIRQRNQQLGLPPGMVVTTSTLQKLGLPEVMSGLAGLLQNEPRSL